MPKKVTSRATSQVAGRVASLHQNDTNQSVESDGGDEIGKSSRPDQNNANGCSPIETAEVDNLEEEIDDGNDNGQNLIAGVDENEEETNLVQIETNKTPRKSVAAAAGATSPARRSQRVQTKRSSSRPATQNATRKKKTTSGASPTTNLNRMKFNYSKWENNYQALVDFHRVHGHVDPPDGYTPPPSTSEDSKSTHKLGNLHRWLLRQKTAWRDGLLSMGHFKKLNELGVEFPPRASNVVEDNLSILREQKKLKATLRNAASAAKVVSPSKKSPSTKKENENSRKRKRADAGLNARPSTEPVDALKKNKTDIQGRQEGLQQLARAEAAALERDRNKHVDHGNGNASSAEGNDTLFKSKYSIDDAIRMVIKRGLTPMEALRATLFPCAPYRLYRRLDALRKLGLEWRGDSRAGNEGLTLSSNGLLEEETVVRKGSKLDVLKTSLAPTLATTSKSDNVSKVISLPPKYAKTNKTDKEVRYLRALQEGITIYSALQQKKDERTVPIRSLCMYLNEKHGCYTGRKVNSLDLKNGLKERGGVNQNELKSLGGKVSPIPEDLWTFLGWESKEGNGDEGTESNEGDESHKMEAGDHDKESRYRNAFIEALEIWRDPDRPKELTRRKLCEEMNTKHECFPTRKLALRTFQRALTRNLNEPAKKGPAPSVPQDVLDLFNSINKEKEEVDNEDNLSESAVEMDSECESQAKGAAAHVNSQSQATDSLDLALSALDPSEDIEAKQSSVILHHESAPPPKKKRSKYRKTSYEVAVERQKEAEEQNDRDSRYRSAFIEALEIWRDPDRPTGLSIPKLCIEMNTKHECLPSKKLCTRTIQRALARNLTEPAKKGPPSILPNDVLELFYVHASVLIKRRKAGKLQWNYGKLEELWTSLVKGTDYEEKISFMRVSTLLKQNYPGIFVFCDTEKFQPTKEEIRQSDLDDLVERYYYLKEQVIALGLDVTFFQADLVDYLSEDDEMEQAMEERRQRRKESQSKRKENLDVRDLVAAKQEKEARYSRYEAAFKEAMEQWMDENDEETMENICNRVNQSLEPGDRLVYPSTVHKAIKSNSDGPMKRGPQSKVNDDLLALVNCHVRLSEFSSAAATDLMHVRTKLFHAMTGTRHEEVFKVDTAYTRFRKKYPETVLLLSQGRDHLEPMSQETFDLLKKDYFKLKGSVAAAGFNVDKFDHRVDYLQFHVVENGDQECLRNENVGDKVRPSNDGVRGDNVLENGKRYQQDTLPEHMNEHLHFRQEHGNGYQDFHREFQPKSGDRYYLNSQFRGQDAYTEVNERDWNGHSHYRNR